MKNWIPILSVAVCLGSTAAVAETEHGQSTQQWLDLQKSGDQAPEDKRPLSGDVAGRTYQRYLKSFETKVPESFDTGLDVGQK